MYVDPEAFILDKYLSVIKHLVQYRNIREIKGFSSTQKSTLFPVHCSS